MGLTDGPDPMTKLRPAVRGVVGAIVDPIACTLGRSGMITRVNEWRSALAAVVDRGPVPGGMRLELGPDAPLEEIVRLSAAEQECCAFLSFTITVDRRGRALEVTGPPDAEPIIADLFGAV